MVLFHIWFESDRGAYLKWDAILSLDRTDNKSTLVQVIAWCRQATSYYLNQCWPRPMTPCGDTRPQCWLSRRISPVIWHFVHDLIWANNHKTNHKRFLHHLPFMLGILMLFAHRGGGGGGGGHLYLKHFPVTTSSCKSDPCDYFFLLYYVLIFLPYNVIAKSFTQTGIGACR